MEKAKCPVTDCRIRVDLVLRSSDQVLIGAHRANLDQYSGGFPPAGAVSAGYEFADLTEDSATIKHLMQFMHKQHYPEVHRIPAGELFNLAEAAEKYDVHSAVAVCRTFILTAFSKAPLPGYAFHEPLQALAYAIKHHYQDIADAVAPFTLTSGMTQMKEALNDDRALFAWLQYKMKYVEEMSAFLGGDHPTAIAMQGANIGSRGCGGHAAYSLNVRSIFCWKFLDNRITSDPSETISECFDTRIPDCMSKKRGISCICERQDRLEDCEIPIIESVRYERQAALGILETLPVFTTYLYKS